ncbi:hypothetical protein [Cryobacterium sp. PAMC25264]|uniref:hypothetical protein n=1 Tax=Cryobacterium sp. PAMC25264 TaxID=2861288 RepID=UPI001C638829|nr:hypothetical protein [Cryobacterium sp. PAMC25264]QYF74289.1 hypothetical protein KY500_03450 [Cryobacterium sp. PAMC25264]
MTGRPARAAWATAAVLVSGLFLTGCTADATSLVRDFLAADRQPDDTLPADMGTPGMDGDSSRLAGSLDGTSYYLAEYVQPETGTPVICLILISTGTEFGNSACGPAEQLRTVGSMTGGATIVEREDPVPDGWTRLGDFLIVNPDARP